VLSSDKLTVPEGGSASTNVTLATPPTTDAIVTVARAGGASDDADLTTDATTLTFTPANWNVPQAVTFAAAQDDRRDQRHGGVHAERAGLATKTVTATEADDDVPPRPAVQTLYVTDDAYARDGSYAAQNFGAGSQLLVKRSAHGRQHPRGVPEVPGRQLRRRPRRGEAAGVRALQHGHSIRPGHAARRRRFKLVGERRHVERPAGQ
jgi:hypothetical protein